MNNAPVFGRGQTFYGPTQSIDTDDYKGVSFEGREVCFNDGKGGELKGRIMRNTSGFTIPGGILVSQAAAYRNKRFAGRTCTTGGQAAGVVDSELGSTGCRNGDLCIVFYSGRTYGYLADSVAADLVEGNLAIAATAATSGATTDAGKLEQVASTAAGSFGPDCVGRFAQTALSTTKKNTLVLVDFDVK